MNMDFRARRRPVSDQRTYGESFINISRDRRTRPQNVNLRSEAQPKEWVEFNKSAHSTRVRHTVAYGNYLRVCVCVCV